MGGQDGWEWRIEAFVKIQKKIVFLGWGVGRGGGGGRVGVGFGVRVDVNGEVKFCENSKKKILGGGVGRGGWGWVGGGPIRGWSGGGEG